MKCVFFDIQRPKAQKNACHCQDSVFAVAGKALSLISETSVRNQQLLPLLRAACHQRRTRVAQPVPAPTCLLLPHVVLVDCTNTAVAPPGCGLLQSCNGPNMFGGPRCGTCVGTLNLRQLPLQLTACNILLRRGVAFSVSCRVPLRGQQSSTSRGGLRPRD